MKVIFTIDSLQQGGAEQSIAHIIKHFSKDVHVTILYFYPKADLLPTYQILGCKIIAMNLQGKYEWLKAISGMVRILKMEQPDIVVSSLYRSNIISRMACQLTGTKLVGTFVDDSYNKQRRNTFKGILGFLKFRSTWFLDFITCFIPRLWIANGEYIRMSNGKHLSIDIAKIKVVYRGRNINEFIEWKNPEIDNFIFVCIGRLGENKGYPELIKAFSKIAQNKAKVQLIIFGDGAYRMQMQKQIEDLKLSSQIILAGNVTNAAQKLYGAHCFVFPSRTEGFSGALVEAMMTGIPIIASDIPMNLEAVEDQHTALVHQVKNENDLANKMLEMISNYTDMIEMGKRARAVAIEKFEIKTIAKQYESVLLEIASGR